MWVFIALGALCVRGASDINPEWTTPERVAATYEYDTNRPAGVTNCLGAQIAENGIVPADRSEMEKPLRIAYRNWASHTYLADMVQILLEETMGFHVTISRGAADVHWKYMDRVDLSDLDLESWLVSGADVLRRLTIDTNTCINYGSVGFDGLEGFYAPSYMRDPVWQAAQADKPWAGLDDISGFYPFYWESFQDDNIVDILKQINYKTIFDDNVDHYTSEGEPMKALIDDGYEWPSRDTADSWDKVFVNDDLCDADAAIPSSQAGDCITWIGGESSWAHGYMQSMIRQRELKINIDFLGYYGLMAYVPYLIEMQYPVYFFWWTPDSFLAPFGNNVNRVTLPAKDDTTFSSTNENLDGKDSSYNADLQAAFVSKIARSSALETDVVQDIKQFLLRLNVDSVRIMSMLADQAAIGEPQWNSACEYLKANPTFWLPLVQNAYVKPELIIVHDLRGAYFGIFVTVCVTVVIANFIVWLVSDKKIVRLSSWRISAINSLGICTTMAAVYYWTIDSAEEGATQESLDNVCMSRAWLLGVGATLFFTPIAAKLYRVKRIFTSAALNAVQISDWRLAAYVAGTLSLVCLYLLIWTLASPPKFQVFTEAGNPDEARSQYGLCVYETYGTLAVYVLLLVPIILCTQWAWDTRNVVVKAINDSKQVAIVMCFFTFFTVTQIILLLFVEDPRVILTMWMFYVSCVGIVTLTLTYGPLYYAIHTGQEELMTSTLNKSNVQSVVVSSVGASVIGESVDC